MKFPTMILEFMHQFPDDDACRAYLEKMRWPNGFVCLRCPAWGSFALFKVNLTECVPAQPVDATLCLKRITWRKCP